jgi:exodeoxyribonuclease-5
MGDHGQLPPIGKSFNLLENPDFKLTHIHRQALNSPIISLSQYVRRYGYIPNNRKFSNEVFKLSWDHPKCKKIWNNKIVFDKDLMVLCAFNKTRVELNTKIREKLGHPHKEKCPEPGEQIVCLQNNHSLGIMNGQIGEMIWLMPGDMKLYRFTINIEDQPDPIECMASLECFGEESYNHLYNKSPNRTKQHKYATKVAGYGVNYFDFGYCISVHKSQGSEWDRIILFEQRTSHWDDEYYARWLYTAITRARHKLFIISDFWG